MKRETALWLLDCAVRVVQDRTDLDSACELERAVERANREEKRLKRPPAPRSEGA